MEAHVTERIVWLCIIPETQELPTTAFAPLEIPHFGDALLVLEFLTGFAFGAFAISYTLHQNLPDDSQDFCRYHHGERDTCHLRGDHLSFYRIP